MALIDNTPVPCPPGASLELRLPIAVPHAAVLSCYGWEGILDLVASGHSLMDIADMLGMGGGGPGALSNWINQQPAERRLLYEEAKKRSAELLMDKAGRMLEEIDLETVTAPAANIYKLRYEHAARRAAQRNVRYRDKAPPAEDGQAQPDAPRPPSFQIVIAPGASATIDGRTIEGEPGRD